ncbi:MAG: hypothetical protein AB7F89_09140 [Pirellulaceae bacterium]
MDMAAALQVHTYLVTHHVRDGALIGPDPGVRFNYRIGRFGKSYLPWIPWHDDLYYLQAQGYWILANGLLTRHGQDRFAELARLASRQIVRRQRADGAWDYPNREWRGRVATVEGVWASLGLLNTFRRERRDEYLAAVLRWHTFFEAHIGFQTCRHGLAVNYFAGESSSPVPNNSVLLLRYLAALAEATGDDKYLQACPALLDFVQHAQSPCGELPYVIGAPGKQHFQCFQYHAFMMIDLAEYARLTGDARAFPIAERMRTFLGGALTAAGDARYACGCEHRTVNYHTAAVAAALSLPPWSDSDSSDLAQRAYARLVSQIRPDGAVPHSRGDYRWLSDRRAYPRYLAMMAYHLLVGTHSVAPASRNRTTPQLGAAS